MQITKRRISHFVIFTSTTKMIQCVIKVLLVLVVTVCIDAKFRDLLKLELISVDVNENIGVGITQVTQINAGTVCIGTPCQNFTVMMDTGSADLWVASTHCTSDSCDRQSRFDEKQSSTFRRVNGQFSITYGTGNLKGIYGEDTVSIAGVEVQKQKFGEATTSSSQFANAGLDGILGLSFKGLSRGGSLPLFYNMISQNVVKEPVFTFCRSGPFEKKQVNELILGASDPTRYPGKSMTYVPVNGNTYWKFEIDKLIVGDDDSACPDGCTAVADSGTTNIRGPEPIITAINDLIGATPIGNNQYKVDCRHQLSPPVNFVIGGKTFTMNSKDYIFRINSKTCVTGFSVSQTKSANFLILGAYFLKGKCTMFDFGQKRLGFVDI